MPPQQLSWLLLTVVFTYTKSGNDSYKKEKTLTMSVCQTSFTYCPWSGATKQGYPRVFIISKFYFISRSIISEVAFKESSMHIYT